MIYKFDGKQPVVGKNSYISDISRVIGVKGDILYRYKEDLSGGLSGVMGNCHASFLGGLGMATSPGYPTGASGSVFGSRNIGQINTEYKPMTTSFKSSIGGKYEG